MSETIYLALYEEGSYSDWVKTVIGVYSTLDQAQLGRLIESDNRKRVRK